MFSPSGTVRRLYAGRVGAQTFSRRFTAGNEPHGALVLLQRPVKKSILFLRTTVVTVDIPCPRVTSGAMLVILIFKLPPLLAYACRYCCSPFYVPPDSRWNRCPRRLGWIENGCKLVRERSRETPRKGRPLRCVTIYRGRMPPVFSNYTWKLPVTRVVLLSLRYRFAKSYFSHFFLRVSVFGNSLAFLL